MSRVLIADDSKFMRYWLKRILEQNGHHMIFEAKNGLEAIDLYDKHRPNIVILDITMDHMDGLTALKQIKKKDSNATVIMCSSLGSNQIIMEALNYGAEDFIIKPYFDKLSETIKNVELKHSNVN